MGMQCLATSYVVMMPDGLITDYCVELPKEPSWALLRSIVEPHLGGALMQPVCVLNPSKTDKFLSMFIDESALLKGLPRNEEASAYYHAAYLFDDPNVDIGKLPWVAGAAVLFNRCILPECGEEARVRQNQIAMHSPTQPGMNNHGSGQSDEPIN
jgi:hypothetical protein